jgi:GAF domain-containing protein/predicted DNA-binding transcriptional regulator AlpA
MKLLKNGDSVASEVKNQDSLAPAVSEVKSQSPFAMALAAILDDTQIFTRRQWAEFLDISESAISQWVTDKTLPRPEHLRKIVRFLQDSDGVPPELLFGFSEVCALPARQVSPLSARLGEDRTFDQYMLRPLRNALQSTLSALPAAQQEQVLLAANEAARHALVGNPVDKSRSARLLDAMEERTAAACVELGATSICFYVADPLFEGDFLLALKAGVRYPEPLAGPRFPLKTRALSRFEEVQSFFKDARSARPLRADCIDTEVSQLIARNQLYGDFIEREGVRSCARLQHTERDRLACVLFVNYTIQEEFRESTRTKIGSFFDELVSVLPDITAAYRVEPWGEELRTLPIALQQFLAEHKDRGREALKRGLEIIIERILETLGLDPADTLGSVHVFESDTRVLRPAALVSRRPVAGALPVLRVSDGEGLLSWAALRRRAIMVNDLETSPFRTIYKPISKDIRSELAIPMFAGSEIVAVLNLESVHPNVFSERVLRPISWAASQMAVVWQNFLLRKYSDVLEGLLDAVDRDPKRSLRSIAEVAVRELGFARCDIWRFDNDRREFTGLGGADPSDVALAPWPRPSGWTFYVANRGVPIFVSEIQSRLDFNAFEWNGRNWQALQYGAPKEINPKNLSLGFKAALGVPLTSNGLCVGVLWLKFEEAQHPPEPSLLRTIEVFARRASPIVLAAAA